MRFDNFPHVNKKLYYFGYSAKIFSYLAVGLVILFIILFTISKFLLFVFAPILIATFLFGDYIKKQQNKGNRDFLTSYLSFKKVPVILKDRMNFFKLIKKHF